MSVSREAKQEAIDKFKITPNDTGSADVQVAILTERIKNLTEHMKIHKKDYHTRRGLLLMVSRRRKLLDFLKASKVDRYKKVVQDLGLRR